MKVTREVVQRIANLAQLDISEDQLQPTIDRLTRILDLVEQMQTIDTRDVEPMANPLDAHQVLRPDLVTESDQRERFLAIAPETEDGLYLVPRVVE